MKPKYELISEDIRNKIVNKKFIGNKLPTGKELAKEYNSSLLTITKALNILVFEGYLLRKKGSGTFIKESSILQKNVKHLYGTLNKEGRDNVVSYILKFEIIKASDDMASKLNIEPDSFIYNIIRVREIKKRKTIIEYTYMPVSLVPNLKEKHLLSSIYDYLKEDLNIKIKSSNLFIKSALPNELELNNLDFNNGEFLIETEQIVFTDSSQIIEYSIARHVHDTFVFESTYIK